MALQRKIIVDELSIDYHNVLIVKNYDLNKDYYFWNKSITEGKLRVHRKSKYVTTTI